MIQALLNYQAADANLKKIESDCNKMIEEFESATQTVKKQNQTKTENVVKTSSWVATDGLGRKISTNENSGNERKG